MASFLKPLLLGALTAGLLAACASDSGQRPPPSLQGEDAIVALERWVAGHPNDVEARTRLARVRELTQVQLLRAADGARTRGDFDAAERDYTRVLTLFPGQPQALDGLVRLVQARRQQTTLQDADQLLTRGDEAGARLRVQQVLAETPTHPRARQLLRDLDARAARRAADAPAPADSVLAKPVSMEFRNVPLSVVFNLLSKSTGVQFVFDRDVRLEAQASLFVHDATLLEALNLLLASQQLDKQVLNGKSVLIYPANPGKQRDLQQLQVRTFYLGNADAKTTVNLLKSILKLRDVYVDEKLNLLVVRDTPEALDIAQKLIANQDLAEPEVVLEVEVLEVSTNKLSEMGLRWPQQASVGIAGTSGSSTTSGTVNRGEWRNLGDANVLISITDPAFVLNLKAEDGGTTTLANPRIRVKNREKAKVHVGDRVPVITTTTNQNTGSVAESVNYLDVGLKLEMEPQVYLDNDVQIKLSLEVSNIVKEIKTSSGLLAYQLGTRNTSTALRLKDGETQVIAGLIKRDGQNSAAKVPGLGEIPILGKLFGSERRSQDNTEIVLLLTPRVVRNLALPAASDQLIPAGTDAAPGEPRLQLNSRAQVGIVPERSPAAGSTLPGSMPAEEMAPVQEIAPQASPAQRGAPTPEGGETPQPLPKPPGADAPPPPGPMIAPPGAPAG